MGREDNSLVSAPRSVSVRVSVSLAISDISCRSVSLRCERNFLKQEELVESIGLELLLDTVEVNGSSPFGPTISYGQLNSTLH